MVQKIYKTDAKFELGYWAIRGLAQPIRFLLAYVKEPVMEIRLGINQDGSPISDEDADWEAHKSTLNLSFPNLPYLIDYSSAQNVQLTQSNSIIRYLARKFNLYGTTQSECMEIDLLQDEAYDFRNKIVGAAYTLGNEYQAAYNEFVNISIPRYLNGFERYLESRTNQSYFVGNQLSSVDFVLYELIWQASIMAPGSITDSRRPCLNKFLKGFSNITEINNYMKSDIYLDRPINSVWASFL